MKKSLLLMLTLCLVFHITYAEDFRDKVKNNAKSIIPLIDPDNHIFGMKYGATEDQIIAEFGSPGGYLRLDQDETVMIYGRAIGFIFTSQKLSGIFISQSLIDHKLAGRFTNDSIFSRNRFSVEWELTNGIKWQAPLSEIRESLGKSLKEGEHNQYYYETDKSKITLSFSQPRGSELKLYGIAVFKK